MADDERDRDVDQRQAGRLRQLRQLLDRVELALVLRQRQVVAVGEALGARRGRRLLALAPAPGQPAAGQRAPRDHAHAEVLAGRQDLELDRDVRQRGKSLDSLRHPDRQHLHVSPIDRPRIGQIESGGDGQRVLFHQELPAVVQGRHRNCSQRPVRDEDQSLDP